MDSYQFLLILRIALVAILYLVILQIVTVARRELRVVQRVPSSTTASKPVVGHLIVVDEGSTPLDRKSVV